MERLKSSLFLVPAWIILVVLLIFSTNYYHEKEVASHRLKFLQNLNAFQQNFNEKITKKEEELNQIAESLSKDPSTRLPCDMIVYIFNKDLQLIKTTDPIYNQLPATKNVNDLLLITPISQTPEWATINGLNRAYPEIFYSYPVKKNGHLVGTTLFRFQNAEAILDVFLEDYKKYDFNKLMYVYKNGVGGHIVYDKNFKVEESIIRDALNGDKNIYREDSWFGANLKGTFYAPSYKFGIVVNHRTYFSIILICQLILLKVLLIVGICWWISKPNRIPVTIVLGLGLLSTYLGYLSYKEKTKKTNEYTSSYLFSLQNAATTIDQYIAQSKGVLDTFVTLKYELNLTDEKIKDKLQQYNVLAVNYFENPQDTRYQKTTTLSNLNWKTTDTLSLPYTENYKIEGPVRDPAIGMIFIISTQTNVPNRGTASIVVSAEMVDNTLEILQQKYFEPFKIIDKTNYPLYQYKDAKKNEIEIEIPSADWTFLSTQKSLKIPPFTSNVYSTFFYVLFVFFISCLFLLHYYVNTIGSITTLLIAAAASTVLALIFLSSCIDIIEIKNKKYSNQLAQHREQIRNQIEAIETSYFLKYEETLKVIPVKLQMDYMEKKGINLVLAKGSISLPSKNDNSLFLWTAAPSGSNIQGSATIPSSYNFNSEFLDLSDFSTFPFNPGSFVLPIVFSSHEKVLYVPDFDNLEELSSVQMKGFNFIATGCKYIFKEGSDVPTLHYEFIYERSVFHALASYILPLIIALSILYQSFLTRKAADDAKKHIAVWASVMFVTIVIYVNFRAYVTDRLLTFEENLFIGSFVFLVGLQVLTLFENLASDEKFLQYIKFLYWPCWLFISMFVAFIAILN